jgi:hypothetical protein
VQSGLFQGRAGLIQFLLTLEQAESQARPGASQ